MTEKLELPQQKSEQTPVLVSFFSLFVGVCILSGAAILIRFSEQELSPNATIFNRLWIAAVALWLWYGIKVVRQRLSPRDSLELQETYTITVRDFLLLLVDGIVGSACLVTWAWSLTQTSVANSNLLHNVTPIFATLGGWLFFRHSFDGKFLLSITLAWLGASFIGIEDWQVATNNLIGDAVALLSAVLNAGHYLIIEKLRAKLPTESILRWYCLFGSLLVLPFALIAKDKLFPSSVSGWLAVISLGILCSIIGQGIITHYLKKFSAGFVTLFLLLEPLLTAILAWIVFNELLSPLNWLAFFLVLAGIYLAKSSQGIEKST